MLGRSSSALVSLGVVSSASLALVACAGATPAAQSSDTAVVNVAVVAPPAAPKPEQVEEVVEKTPVDPKIARQAALQDAMEYGMIGLLGGDSGAIFGGSVGGTLGGGQAFGTGGLGLSGIGVGAGGRGEGIGLGSIGTIGHGSIGSISGFGTSGPPGTSVLVSGSAVIEMGDTATLGLTPEQGMRVVRDRTNPLLNCYSKSQQSQPQLAGSLGLRVVVKQDGRVAFVRIFDSTLGDQAAHDCLTKALKDAYVGSPSGSFYGVVETRISFRPAPKK